MRIIKHRVHILFLALLLGVASGCNAQKNSGTSLSSDEAWRIEILFRSVAQLPTEAEIHIGSRTSSELPGFDQIDLTYSVHGQSSKPITLLLSKDGKVLAQFRKFDISKEDRPVISEEGRPSRGGPINAPVSIVVFDDLECPFCARLNSTLFPEVNARYGNQVRIIYQYYPIDGHPWSLRGANDIACLAKQSLVGFWNAVDLIHSQAATLGGPDGSLSEAKAALDQITLQVGQHHNVDISLLKACIDKQDSDSILKSRNEGETLGVISTPTLFVNGAKIEGAVSMNFLFAIIDKALLARGITPPPSPDAPPQVSER